MSATKSEKGGSEHSEALDNSGGRTDGGVQRPLQRNQRAGSSGHAFAAAIKAIQGNARGRRIDGASQRQQQLQQQAGGDGYQRTSGPPQLQRQRQVGGSGQAFDSTIEALPGNARGRHTDYAAPRQQQHPQQAGYQRTGGPPQRQHQHQEQAGGNEQRRIGGPPQRRLQPQQQGSTGGRRGRGWAPQQHGRGYQHSGMARQQNYAWVARHNQQQYYSWVPEHNQQVLQSQRSGGSMGGGVHVGFVASAGGPSQPLVQHQVVMTQAMTQPEASSSLRATVHFENLSISGEASSSETTIQPFPVSNKSSFKYAPCPGKGKIGSRCLVKANHFLVKLQKHFIVHQYDVSINPEVRSSGLNRAVISELVHMYKESHLGNHFPAYDGKRSLYTAGKLPFSSKEFRVILSDDNGNREFKVGISFTSCADLSDLQRYIVGQHDDEPEKAIQVLDIVLRQMPNSLYSPLGRSFFSPDLGETQPLGEGLECWRGFYQSVRPTQMGLSLNVDISANSFIEALPVIEFATQLLNKDVYDRPLSEADFKKVKNALNGVKLKVTHRGNMQRRYRIFGLTSQPTRDITFEIDDRGSVKLVSLVDYFQDTYQVAIQYTHLPCLQVGNRAKKPMYLPMEVCQIVEGQKYTKKLNERQITNLLKATCQRPKDRQADIVETVRRNPYAVDPCAKEFGLSISDELATIDARVLPIPRLKYHESGEETECLPQVGQWNMMKKKMVNGGRVDNWICINFERKVQGTAARTFYFQLAQMCITLGMQFNPEPVLENLSALPDRAEIFLKNFSMDATTLRKKELDLIIFILPDINGSLYGELKRICETDLGIVSQCCLAKHVSKISKQYLSSVALKINVKVGGRNTVLVDALSRRIPFVTDRPTIIFGADVSHPRPGEDSSPSIAAVVASRDWPEITKYAGLVCAQAHRKELIGDLFMSWQDEKKGKLTGGMIREHLLSFKRETGYKPERIIFFRDGVSQGQFSQVLFHELDAIRKACDSLEPNYQPPITFAVVQKKHHTKLFAFNHGDFGSVDRSGNILPGTVVDTKISHPRAFDFYLCSQAGVQGTSRPAHYIVLWDENNFSADAFQSITYNLCYTFARCTRSVSLVPPVYYAHLAAFRARLYIESGSVNDAPAGRRSTRVEAANAPVSPLPALKENVKNVMFFC